MVGFWCQESITVKTRSLKLPRHLDQDLDAWAKRRSVSRSTLVREALAEYFVQHRSASSQSVLDRARDLAGCAEGPPDLSTNARHLEGYGRSRR
jgi:predicted transcriptional regulator